MTEQLNIGVRFALYANLMLLFGLPLFRLHALKGAERLQNTVLPFRIFIFGLSLSAIALSLLSIVAMTASMAGVRLLEVDPASISMIILETSMGIAWCVRMLALFSILIVAFWVREAKGLPKLMFVVLASGVALGSLAWTGHGAASEGSAGIAQLIADIIHLLSAGAWLGALAALSVMLLRSVANLGEDYLRLIHRLLEGFSLAGTVIVTLVFGSGLVNSWMLVGPQNVRMLHTTPYGQLLIVKLLLFAVMLALAGANRFRLTPEFNRALNNNGTSGALAKLRKSLAVELSIALIILGIIAWLGTLEPPISM